MLSRVKILPSLRSGLFRTDKVALCYRSLNSRSTVHAMRPPLRIAVLECDTPIGNTKRKYGGYGGLFTALLKAGVNALDQPEVVSSEHGLDISYWEVVDKQEYPKDEDIDAVLITGSKFDSFANDEWILKLVQYTQHLLNEQERIRLIGVCFGHQIIGRAMGAKVGRNARGWEVSVTPMKLTEKGDEIFGKSGTMSLHQMHRDIVYEWPKGVVPLGMSPVCEVQAFHIPKRVLAVQGHPEFNEEIVRELLDARRDQGIFNGEMYSEATGRVADHHDGIAVSSAFIRFLLED